MLHTHITKLRISLCGTCSVRVFIYLNCHGISIFHVCETARATSSYNRIKHYIETLISNTHGPVSFEKHVRSKKKSTYPCCIYVHRGTERERERESMIEYDRGACTTLSHGFEAARQGPPWSHHSTQCTSSNSIA